MTYKKIVHRLWLGSEDMPQRYVEFGEKWEELNPGWVVMDHGEEVVQMWPDLADIFNYLYDRSGADLNDQVSEIVGYALIREFGGIYVDCDMEPVAHDIEKELPNMAWASYENEEDWLVANTAIGAPRPDNEFWTELLKELPRHFFENAGYIQDRFLTDFASQRMQGIYIFPQWSFYSEGHPMALALRG